MPSSMREDIHEYGACTNPAGDVLKGEGELDGFSLPVARLFATRRDDR